MSNVSIGDIRKLDERAVVVVGVNGDDVQVDHFSRLPFTPVIHADRLAYIAPTPITAERLQQLREYAVQYLPSTGALRDLAQYVLQLTFAYDHREKRADDVESALQDEGKALDDVARELEVMRQDLANALQSNEALAAEVKFARDDAQKIVDICAKDSDSTDRTINRLRNELATTKEERDEARAVAERATECAEKLAVSTKAACNLFRDAFASIGVGELTLATNATQVEVVGKAVDAIHEFGILNREMLDIGRIIFGAVPRNKNGERISVTVGRVVAMLAERDVELAKWQDHECEKTRLGKAIEVLDKDKQAWLSSLPEFTPEQRERAALYPTAEEEAQTLAAMSDDVHAPNDEHMANVEAAIDGDEPPYSHERFGTGNEFYAMAILAERDNRAMLDDALDDVRIEMGADPNTIYSADEFRASAHAQLATPAEPLVLSPNATRVIDYLRGYVGTEGGQRGSALRDALKLSPSDWNKAKKELMDARLIKSDGKGHGTVYSAVAR